MRQWSAERYLGIAVGGGALALLSVWAMEALQHGRLAWWAHIPLTVVVLTGMAVGGGALGVGLVEYQARRSKQPA